MCVFRKPFFKSVILESTFFITHKLSIQTVYKLSVNINWKQTMFRNNNSFSLKSHYFSRINGGAKIPKIELQRNSNII